MAEIVGDLLMLSFFSPVILLALKVPQGIFLFSILAIVSFWILSIGWGSTYLIWKDELKEARR